MQSTKSWLDRAVEQKAKNCTVFLAHSYELINLAFNQLILIDKASLN